MRMRWYLKLVVKSVALFTAEAECVTTAEETKEGMSAEMVMPPW